MITLDSPIATVLGDRSGKGRKIQDGLGLHTVGDLLHHFPRRYLETGSLSRVADLRPGQLLAVVGEIVSSREHTYRDRRTGRPAYRLETVLRTDGADLSMTFFSKKQGMARWQAGRLSAGRRGVFLGKVDRFRNAWQLTNPAMTLFGLADDDLGVPDEIPPLYPIYPLTKGVETWDVHRAVAFARSVVDEVPDLLPEALRREHDLPDTATALRLVHAPEHRDEVGAGLRRFRFDEALVTQVVLGRRRRAQREVGGRPCDGGDGALLAAFDARLPFTLTAGQERIGAEIDGDLARSFPMNRLLQGEVGSGKTLVALRAMLRVVDSGAQAVLLAPTEVLAQQHHRAIGAMLGDLGEGGLLGGAAEGTRVDLLTGSMTKAQRAPVLSALVTGETGILIGTHALLEDAVQPFDLGLVVIDEQHRFGVEQRAALTGKTGFPPHVLVMTATPIPRTVAMTVFGDLETSVLDELPAGRAPIQTNLVDLSATPAWEARVWQRVREEVDAGHQVYVVCPRITGDELEQGERDAAPGGPVDPDADDAADLPADPWADRPAAAVEEVVATLSAGPLAGLRVAPLHGRMPADEKDAAMRAFAAGDTDVLVATTVIEVGVDVHNATTMVVLDADRFGVSQLHQLRGRVGRGGLPGLCLLVTGDPRAAADPAAVALAAASPARRRLTAVASTTDGFALSRTDLELRREGDVLGASQAGRRSSLLRLRVLRDEDTIVEARSAAEALLDDDPALASAPLLAAEVAAMEADTAAEFVDKA